MPWFKVDDAFHAHPKVKRAGNAAVGLYVRCGSWSSAYLSDGHIDSKTARDYGRPAEIERLLMTRLWVVNGDGFIIPDYLDYNPSREQVLAGRAADRERQARRRREPNGQYG